jgi:O-antigen ligase
MWKVVPTFGTFEARHAENELLQQFYAYGVVGVVMLFGLYGSLYRQIRRLPQAPLRLVFVSIVIFAIVRGFAEAEPFDLLLPLWAVVMITMLVNWTDPPRRKLPTSPLPAPFEGPLALQLSSNCNF